MNRDYQILNCFGRIIGMANADNPRAAVVAWNLRNLQSQEFAFEAYCPETNDESGGEG